MENEILSLASVLFFCVCCHQFIKAIVTPIPLFTSERPYARPAMQLEKFYKVVAWGVMSGTFLMALIYSFQKVFVAAF